MMSVDMSLSVLSVSAGSSMRVGIERERELSGTFRKLRFLRAVAQSRSSMSRSSGILFSEMGPYKNSQGP